MSNYWIKPSPNKVKRIKTDTSLWAAFIVLIISICIANYIRTH